MVSQNTNYQTPLYQTHLDSGAKMMEFANWQMPMRYQSELEEWRLVREVCGIFDIAHMSIIDCHGADAEAFLQSVLCNDVAKMAPFTAQYSCFLNETGGVIDDVMVYKRSTEAFIVVFNAAFLEHIPSFVALASGFDAKVLHRKDLAMLALQGPKARSTAARLAYCDGMDIANMGRFSWQERHQVMVARTGYTGEDGLEFIVPQDQLKALWQAIIKEGVAPIGYVARDILRLEAGLNLSGADMHPGISPYSANIGFCVDMRDTLRDFIGKAALIAQKSQQNYPRQVGLALQEGPMLRAKMEVYQGEDQKVGYLTSAGYSPHLGCTIAFAQIASPDDSGPFWVKLRGKKWTLSQSKTRFLSFDKAVP